MERSGLLLSQTHMLEASWRTLQRQPVLFKYFFRFTYFNIYIYIHIYTQTETENFHLLGDADTPVSEQWSQFLLPTKAVKLKSYLTVMPWHKAREYTQPRLVCGYMHSNTNFVL